MEKEGEEGSESLSYYSIRSDSKEYIKHCISHYTVIGYKSNINDTSCD